MNRQLLTPGQSLLDEKERSLRPQSLDEYVGQERNIEKLKIFIEAAKIREKPLDHVLLYGPPGLGKTTLATIIAKEMGVNIKITSGPAIERTGDLAAILSSLKENDVLFIDEIHRLNRTVEEVLYPAMEDYALDIMIGKGPGARSVRLELPKFTLIGATTRSGDLSSPLRDRFGVMLRLELYTKDELKRIIERSAKKLAVEINESSTSEIAKRSRGTPRIVNRLLKRVSDFALVSNDGIIDEEITEKALDLLEIDHLGLDQTDIRILRSIIETFDGGPVGIDTLAASTGEDRGDIEDVCEPYLLQIGFIKRTPRGRVVMKRAYDHLGLSNMYEVPRDIEILSWLDEDDDEDQ